MSGTENGSQYGEQLQFFADWQKNEGRRTGLNVQYVQSRQGVPTLMFELAPIERSGSAPRWDQKITLQLSREELAACCAVLLGCRYEFEASYHGEGRNKGVQVRSKAGEGALVILSHAGRRLMHILSPEQRISLCAFSLRRLSMLYQMPVTAVIEVVRSCELGVAGQILGNPAQGL